MATTYQHLTIEERDTLAVLRGQGLSLRDIAQALGSNVGTVSRELKRYAPPVHSGYYMSPSLDQIVSHQL
jgi:IS30 family transposase